VGLPSELLERRPDIREAEETLVAANAEIGAAKAALFPSISLTGTAGYESFALNNLFTHAQREWNGAASLTQPVFAAGALRSGIRLAEAQKQEMLLIYQQTIMTPSSRSPTPSSRIRRPRVPRAAGAIDGGGRGCQSALENTLPAWRH